MELRKKVGIPIQDTMLLRGLDTKYTLFVTKKSENGLPGLAHTDYGMFQ